MNRTTLIIAIGIIIAACTAIYFYTEWEKAQSRPFEVFVTAEEMPRTSTGKETAKPKRPDIWADHDLDFPPEGAPRPLKHLNALELHNFSLAPDLTDEELIQVQSEFFFRYVTKEKREDLRRGRAYAREQRAALKAFREKYPARDSAD